MTPVSQPADPDAVRIGNLEREDAMRILGEHFTAGRLQVDEYDQRVNQATVATTRAHLRVLFTDLPAPYPPFMAPPVWSAPPPRPVGAPPGAIPVYPGLAPRHDLGVSDKSKVVAGILQLITPFGLGRFYIGHTGVGLAQLLTCGGFGIWTLVDGIVLLVNGGTDGYGRRLRD